MELSDLEKKLFSASEEKKSAPKPAPKPAPKAAKPEPKPKPEPKKPKAKKEELSLLKMKEEPAPAPKPVPAPAKPTKVSKYDLGGVEGPPKPKKEKPAPAPKPEKKAPAPRVKKEKPAPKAVAPKAPAVKDPNAVPAGVALGAAPLLLAPIALLGAGRGVLSGTKARREKIQAEIAAAEAAKKKKAVQAEVDGGGVVTALVRGSVFFVCNPTSSRSDPCFVVYRDFWEHLQHRWP